jgi:hypothetical protein
VKRLVLICAILSAGFLGIPAAFAAGPGPFESSVAPKARNQIDVLVFSKLRSVQVQPANLCSDSVFLRRAYLDVIGTLPSGYEAREFALSASPNKRKELVERLLERPEFADYWAMKWCDLLRVKSEFPVNLWPNAVQAYHHWIRTSIKENLPYDRFAREMLTSSGSNFRVPQVNFYRAMQDHDPAGIARTVALTFMGERADRWPKERLSGMAEFFAQVCYKPTGEWKEEIVFHDPFNPTNRLNQPAVFPDGTRADLSNQQDPRRVFADWLTAPGNPWFARNMVNRIWFWLMGRGIVQEPDDMSPDNPPQNEALLAFLEKELIGARYDLKHIYRLILTSDTYQLSSIPPEGDAAKAEANFACYSLRRLDAEVLIDALNEITGTTEKYSSAIPEPFTFVPEDQRAISLADGSISSAFLEMFGRPSRDTGLQSERNLQPTAGQSLHLLNSTHIQKKIEQSRMVQYQTQSARTVREMAVGIYLGVLSRFPTAEELKTIDNYADSSKAKRRELATDLAWALINTGEFLYRH